MTQADYANTTNANPSSPPSWEIGPTPHAETNAAKFLEMETDVFDLRDMSRIAMTLLDALFSQESMTRDDANSERITLVFLEPDLHALTHALCEANRLARRLTDFY